MVETHNKRTWVTIQSHDTCEWNSLGEAKVKGLNVLFMGLWFLNFLDKHVIENNALLNKTRDK